MAVSRSREKSGYFDRGNHRALKAGKNPAWRVGEACTVLSKGTGDRHDILSAQLVRLAEQRALSITGWG